MLKVAVVGCGKIADGHVEEINNLPKAKLVAVCDLEPLMAEQLAQRYNVPHFYDNLQTMLGAESVDVVHVTTPPSSHFTIAETCARAGAHVFMEKPLALDSAEAKRLVRAVEGAGRKVCINYWPNFEAPGLALRELLASGKIGQIVHVESYYGYNLQGAYGQALIADAEHWVHRLPGKLFQNIIDHPLNKIALLLPEGNAVIHAEGYRRTQANRRRNADMLDELRVLISCGGATAYATFTSNVKPIGHFLRVYGTDATVHVDYNMRTVVLESEQSFPSALGRLFPPFRQGLAYFREAVRNVRRFSNYESRYFAGMGTLIQRFYSSIEHDEPAPISTHDMIRVSEWMDEIFAQTYGGVTV